VRLRCMRRASLATQPPQGREVERAAEGTTGTPFVGWCLACNFSPRI
jgi:hypothetical protein